jgi:hypothetical protein
MKTLLKACVVALVWQGIDARPPVNRAKGAFGLEEVISGELSSVGFSGTWISGECRNEFFLIPSVSDVTGHCECESDEHPNILTKVYSL